MVVQRRDRERRLSGGKDFLNAIVHAEAHVSEASLARANVDNAFLAGFGICGSLISSLLCRNLRDHHLWASVKTCPCSCDLWIEIAIFVDRPHHDVNERHCLVVVVGSESGIGLSRSSRSSQSSNVMTLKAIFCVANLRRCSLVYVRELRRWI